MNTNATELINIERQRQIDVEGWDFQHDDFHSEGELFKAAKCYLDDFGSNVIPENWPWENKWWKPTYLNGVHGQIKQRVKAGALFAAEKSRISRSDLPMFYQNILFKYIDDHIEMCKIKIDQITGVRL